MAQKALVITVANSSPPPVGSVIGTDGDDRDIPVVLTYIPEPSVSGAQVVSITDDLAAPGDGGSPTGGAGGVLSGQYPNPGFAVNMATQAELDAHLVDTTPHPAYDDLPSLTLLFQNGLV